MNSASVTAEKITEWIQSALKADATSEEFAATAVGSGFDDSLTGALQQEKTYEVRFFILDCLGKIQNFFHRIG